MLEGRLKAPVHTIVFEVEIPRPQFVPFDSKLVAVVRCNVVSNVSPLRSWLKVQSHAISVVDLILKELWVRILLHLHASACVHEDAVQLVHSPSCAANHKPIPLRRG